MRKLLCLLFLVADCGLAQTVEGTVTDAATGYGAPGVKVELLKDGSVLYDMLTDPAGRFRFDNVKEGDYGDRYQSADYWLTAGWQDYHKFHVAAASDTKLETRLMPWSKIAGRVVDLKGNGVPNARVEVSGSGMLIDGRTYMRTSWGGGGGGQLSQGTPAAMSFSGNTDARGSFDVKLMPGSYSLSVVPPQTLKPPEPAEDGSPLAWKRTYYPDADSAATESKIVLSAGAEVSGITLKLLAVPAHTIRGVVLNPDGSPAPDVTISIGVAPSPEPMHSKPDGSFEISRIPEGEWHCEAENRALKLRASEWVEVGKHDLENVKLRLLAPVKIHGKVLMQGGKDAPPIPREPLILSLRGGHGDDDDVGLPGLGSASPAEPDGQGDFVIDAYPGVYRYGMLFPQPSPSYYLDAIRIGDADLTVQDVEVTFDTEMTVAYRTDGGSVRGKAENCNRGGVVLAPSDPARRRPIFFRSAACDSGGNYEIDQVRPGEYYALAFAGNGPVLKIDQALLNQGVKVTVRAHETSSADLRTVTKPIY